MLPGESEKFEAETQAPGLTGSSNHLRLGLHPITLRAAF
jgi:hypothetical protein